MIVKIENDNQIKIPSELLKELKIKKDGLLHIDVINNKIILTKQIPECIFCNSAVDLIRKSDKYICIDCIQELSKSNINDFLY